MSRRSLVAVAASLMVCAFSVDHSSAELLDRLLAVVNGKVVTEGDLRLARDLNALLSSGQPDKFLNAEQELDRLIEVELLRQELESFPMSPPDQASVEARMQELRQEYAARGGLSAVLRRHGLEEEELEASIRMQMSILRFVDLRFRPFAGVSTEEMQAYYQQKLVPQLQASRSVVPPFEDLANQIKEVLKEEKVTSALEQWLKEAKQRSNIEFFTPSQDSDGRSDRQVARHSRPVLGEGKR